MVSLHTCLDIITNYNGVILCSGLCITMVSLGEGAYGKVIAIQTNDKKYALKETILPEFPEELEAVMASVREQDMNLIHRAHHRKTLVQVHRQQVPNLHGTW